MPSSVRNPLVVLVLLGTALPAVAADPWSLENAVPDGVYLYVHSTKNPEDQFLCDYWNKVWETLRKVGLENDIKTLISSNLGETDRAEFESVWEQAMGLAGGVQWGELFGNEFVYAQAMRLPTPSHLYMFRMDRKLADKNRAGLHAILEAIVGLDEEALRLEETQAHGATIWRLSFADEVNVSLAQRGDVLIAGIEAHGVRISVTSEGETRVIKRKADGRLLDDALRLLNGDKSVKRLIDKRSFRAAMGALPEPESERFFFDAGNLFASIDEGITWIEGAFGPEEAEENGAWFRAARKGIGQFKFIDCAATVTTTEGYSRHCYEVTLMTPDAKDKPLYRAFCGGAPVKQFDKYLPKQATGFSVSSGMDLEALYQAVIDFVRDELPGGQEMLVTWTGLQEQIGFNVEKDLLSWIGNECIHVSMPPAIPNPFGGGDWVLMLQVKDEAKAKETVDRGLAALNNLLTASPIGQPLTTQPANNPSLEGFLSVTHPMMMMFLRPVYGCADGYMIIGSSEKAISRCLKTAKGQNPSVRENKRFAREGLAPSGPVTSVSFKDKSKMGQKTAQALGMVGMFGGMIPADEEGAKVIRAVFGMLQKLAPVVAQINFYKSEASVTVFDGKMYKTHTVTHYKEPPPPVEVADESAPAKEPAEETPEAVSQK